MDNRMIAVTRLGGSEVVINTDLIVTVEKTPDTVITLTTGDRIMVRESVEEVVARAAAFRHRVSVGPGFRGDARDIAASLGSGPVRLAGHTDSGGHGDPGDSSSSEGNGA
jgi:flagellar protein FlbD